MTTLEALIQVKQWIADEVAAIEHERNDGLNAGFMDHFTNGEITSLMALDGYITYMIKKEAVRDGSN